MTAIAGIIDSGNQVEVEQMLNCIAHRGSEEKVIVEAYGATLGAIRSRAQSQPVRSEPGKTWVIDETSTAHFARVDVTSDGFVLTRDPLGLSPLYYGWTKEGCLCFASEVKALLPITRGISYLPAGSTFDGHQVASYFKPEKLPALSDSPERIAAVLREKLENAIVGCTGSGEVGSWLSGGLDSSAVAALANRHVDRLYSFAAGLEGAPDLAFAQEVAAFIQSDHHEVVVRFDDLLRVLPEVISNLESFDPLLVRSSITNYLVAKLAADYVPAVFSGEGGDELFAGYEYLKAIHPTNLADELVDITGRLQNTALQRVDRSASAFGMAAHVVFLDPDVVDYAFRIPVEYKIHGGIEKWILRRALQGLLPETVLARKKAKFWEGAGINTLLAQHADLQISNADFQREKLLPNGWKLTSKEELFYYRFFRERFGELENLGWMGRTKSIPE